MMRLIVGALALGVMSQAAVAQDYPAFHAVVGVALDDALNIRAQPDPNAPVIGEIAPNAMGIEVIAVSDGWAVVNTPDVTGYVALRFLEREEGPVWNTLQQPLTCLGTEPFWSLAVDPVAGTAKFSTPEDAEARSVSLGQTWPGAPWAPSAAVSLPDGMAVFSPAECSDGMSERSYGIAADLFLTGPDRQRLSGCCLLDQP